jgi:hypothetical protein
MYLVSLRFQSVAARLQILCTKNSDLSFENLLSVVQQHLPQRLEEVLANGGDPHDPYTLWDALLIDAVLAIEDRQGRVTCVGVSLHSQEWMAYRTLSWAQKPTVSKARKALKLYRYWIFLVEEKHFPTDGEWVDILYLEIDQPTNKVGCKLIYL